MRELVSTGWIHNRIRRLVASFLVKTLLLPWQWGLKYFWDALLDADLECDSLGWQYVSGGISDGLAFDKIDDYHEEGKIIDPDGVYIKSWVPELLHMPKEYIHMPWEAPESVLRNAGVCVGCFRNYPLPLITPIDAQKRVEEACRVIEQVFAQQQNGYEIPVPENDQIRYSNYPSFSESQGNYLVPGFKEQDEISQQSAMCVDGEVPEM